MKDSKTKLDAIANEVHAALELATSKRDNNGAIAALADGMRHLADIAKEMLGAIEELRTPPVSEAPKAKGKTVLMEDDPKEEDVKPVKAKAAPKKD